MLGPGSDSFGGDDWGCGGSAPPWSGMGLGGMDALPPGPLPGGPGSLPLPGSIGGGPAFPGMSQDGTVAKAAPPSGPSSAIVPMPSMPGGMTGMAGEPGSGATGPGGMNPMMMNPMMMMMNPMMAAMAANQGGGAGGAGGPGGPGGAGGTGRPPMNPMAAMMMNPMMAAMAARMQQMQSGGEGGSPGGQGGEGNPMGGMMNPMAMMMQANPMFANMMRAAGQKEPAPAKEEPKEDVIDPDVQELGDYYNIEDRWIKRLNETMKKRKDTKDQDLAKLYEVLERARSPTGLLTVKIGEMESGQFVGKIKPDKDVERLARKFKLDEHVKSRLTELAVRLKDSKDMHLERLEQHLSYSKHPNAMATLLAGKLLEHEVEELPDLKEAETVMDKFRLDDDAKSKLREIVEKRANDKTEVLNTVRKHLEASQHPSAMLCRIARALIDGEKLDDPPERRPPARPAGSGGGGGGGGRGEGGGDRDRERGYDYARDRDRSSRDRSRDRGRDRRRDRGDDDHGSSWRDRGGRGDRDRNR